MKTPQTNDSLAKAIAYLGAVEVAPGRYAFRAFGEGPWKIAEHLETWPINENSSPAYRVEMPAWWSPDQRFAWRDAKGFMYFHAERAKAYNATERITADLETGAEVPA